MPHRSEVRAALIIARAVLHAHPLDIEAAAAIVRRFGELAPADAQPAVTSTTNAIERARTHESLSYAAMARFSMSRLVMLLERGLIRAAR